VAAGGRSRAVWLPARGGPVRAGRRVRLARGRAGRPRRRRVPGARGAEAGVARRGGGDAGRRGGARGRSTPPACRGPGLARPSVLRRPGTGPGRRRPGRGVDGAGPRARALVPQAAAGRPGGRRRVVGDDGHRAHTACRASRPGAYGQRAVRRGRGAAGAVVRRAAAARRARGTAADSHPRGRAPGQRPDRSGRRRAHRLGQCAGGARRARPRNHGSTGGGADAGVPRGGGCGVDTPGAARGRAMVGAGARPRPVPRVRRRPPGPDAGGRDDRDRSERHGPPGPGAEVGHHPL
jgi:hypothetical protein